MGNMSVAKIVFWPVRASYRNAYAMDLTKSNGDQSRNDGDTSPRSVFVFYRDHLPSSLLHADGQKMHCLNERVFLALCIK